MPVKRERNQMTGKKREENERLRKEKYKASARICNRLRNIASNSERAVVESAVQGADCIFSLELRSIYTETLFDWKYSVKCVGSSTM